MKEELIKSINVRFDEENRPVTIREIDKGFQMCTKPQYHQYIRKLQEQKPKKNLLFTFSTQHHFIAGIYIVILYVFCKFWHISCTLIVFLLNTHVVFYKKIPTK